MAIVIQKWTAPNASYSVKIKKDAEIARYRTGQPVYLKPAADDLSFELLFGKYQFHCVVGQLTINIDAAAQNLAALGAEAICDILAKLVFII